MLTQHPQVEQQRRYLGGDSEHTVLVKGLDFALLEQNKARAAAATEDDDSLEQAFIEGAVAARKRTRADIVQELRNKRVKADGDAPAAADVPIDEAKKSGKFRPIGFKPIGADAATKKKKKVKEGEKEGAKKKKKKNTAATTAADDSTAGAGQPKPHSEESAAAATATQPPPGPEPMDEDDDDIFAGAGEYTGIDLGEDDDDDDEEGEKSDDQAQEGADPGPPSRHKWVDIDEPAPPQRSASPLHASPPPRTSAPPAPDAAADGEEEEGEKEKDAPPARLQPLASSSVPSIRELLALDEEVEKAEKRRARKEKKKKGGELSKEEKVERDYQRWVSLFLFLLSWWG